MNKLTICTAIRNKDVEDEIIKIIEDAGWEHSNVNVDDIVNEHRAKRQVFIVEDSYASILNLIEFHNSCIQNFIPVIVLSAPESKFKNWVDGVKFPEKYFHIGLHTFRMAARQTILAMDAMTSGHKNTMFNRFRNAAAQSFKRSALDFQAFLGETLDILLDMLYAGRGSIMLLNEKGNLVIEAASKRSIVGMEVERRPDSVAWTVIDTMKPLSVENIGDDPRFKKSSSGYAKDHFMSIPIFMNKKIAGVLNLSDKMVSLLFDNEDYKKANELLAILEPYLYIEKLTKYIKAVRNR